MAVNIQHSDYPWLVTIDIPFEIAGDGKRSKWRSEFRRWMKENGIQYLWQEMSSGYVILRVRTEQDAVLIKIKY